MYLLNVTTMKLELVADETKVPYAILSHRWDQNPSKELLYEDLLHVGVLGTSRAHKVEEFCREVRRRNSLGLNSPECNHAWVDTCCIDKKSSAELSEAINGMYSYYKTASYCIAYLQDVHVDHPDPSFSEAFRSSVWFTRCWTLQELIAPNDVIFYNSAWQEIGNRNDLATDVQLVTGIDIVTLQSGMVFRNSLAQRMSWAAARIASRREDIAYSLMGLFDVNMPVLYGEGDKAFRRLQETIIKDSDDESIFAWAWEHLPEVKQPHGHCGLLASSPDAFRHCGNVRPTMLHVRETPLHSLYGGIAGNLVMKAIRDHARYYLAHLNVTDESAGKEIFICLVLTPAGNQTWSRTAFSGMSRVMYTLVEAQKEGTSTEMLVKHQRVADAALPQSLNGFNLTAFPALGYSVTTPSRTDFAMPAPLRNGIARSIFSTRLNPSGPVCNIDCSKLLRGVSFLQLGFTDVHVPICIAIFNPREGLQTDTAREALLITRLKAFDAAAYDELPYVQFEKEPASSPARFRIKLKSRIVVIKGSHEDTRLICELPKGRRDFQRILSSRDDTVVINLSRPRSCELGSIWHVQAGMLT